VIKGSKTILWNGPVGVFEFENFAVGSKAISNAIVEATKKRSILPGWWGVTRWLASTTSAMAEKVSYVSTGGRCNCWRLIEGKVLPGVKAIRGY